MWIKTKTLAIVMGLVASLPISLNAQQELIYEDGLVGLYNLIGRNAKYPPNERRNGKVGQVLLRFRARADHGIDSISVISSASPAMDAEAKRVLQLTDDKWTVGSTSYYLIVVAFVLSPEDRRPNDYKRALAKQLESKNYKKAAHSAEELRKMDPLDLENLDQLIFIYGELREEGKVLAFKAFKEEILDFRARKRIVGEL